MNTGVLLLAAGRSRRFGSDKRHAPVPGGGTLLEAAINTLRDSGLPLRVCLGRDDRALQEELHGAGIDCLLCPHSELGMIGTLGDGIRARPQPWDGVLIALADMPRIRTATYRTIAAQLRTDRIVVPFYRGQRGNPVAFGSKFFPELESLQGDRGARALLLHYPDAVHRVEVDDPGILCDVDTVEMLQGLAAAT